MPTVYEPKYLVVPGILLWLLATFLSINCLPDWLGVPISALLVLAMLTCVSLVHRWVEDDKDSEEEIVRNAFHGMVWSVALLVAFLYCDYVIPFHWAAPVAVSPSKHDLNWLQVSFLVIQQVCYFGVHAFLWRERKTG